MRNVKRPLPLRSRNRLRKVSAQCSPAAGRDLADSGDHAAGDREISADGFPSGSVDE
jgi:hypothetical protein